MSDSVSTEMLQAAAKETNTLNEERLSKLAELCREQLELEAKVEELEAVKKEISDKLKEVSTRKIPDLMKGCGIDKVTLSNGASVEVQPFYSASIPKNRINEAHGWLEENGFGSLIKNEITCPFPKDSEEQQEELRQVLEERGFSFSQKRAVHTQTLKAFVKERIENAEPIDTELFGVFQGSVTKIKTS